MADVLWRDTALTPKIFILDARRRLSSGPLALSLGLVDGGVGACRHCRALSGAAHRHDAHCLFPRHPRGLHGTETRNAKQ